MASTPSDASASTDSHSTASHYSESKHHADDARQTKGEHVSNQSEPTSFGCEICGDTYTSIRAAFLCEDRDLEEEKQARRPIRQVPHARYEDEYEDD